MQKINTILGIGIAIVIIPLLGFPSWWRDVSIIILGLWICGIAVVLKRADQRVDSISGNSKHSKQFEDFKSANFHKSKGNVFSSEVSNRVNDATNYDQTS